MVRCSRSGMGKLPNGFCVVFTVWRLLAIHVSGIFHHDMVAEKYWILKNVCLEIWAPAASKGKSPQYHFSSVCEKEEGQSNYTRAHCSCEFHSWTPGTSNICFFPDKFWKLQSACAHVIPTWACRHVFYIWFSIFCHLSCHILSSQSSFFPVGRFLSLGWGFGAFLVFDCRCLQRGAEDEKIQWNSCASCHSSPNMKNCFQHSKSNLGWILRCPHPGSWVLGPKSWSPAGNT